MWAPWQCRLQATVHGDFSSYILFEPTCADARWALMHRFPSVTLEKFTRQKFISREVRSNMSGSGVICVKVKGLGDIRIPKKGRWAHNNVKLLHSQFHLFCRYLHSKSSHFRRLLFSMRHLLWNVRIILPALGLSRLWPSSLMSSWQAYQEITTCPVFEWRKSLLNGLAVIYTNKFALLSFTIHNWRLPRT